MWRLSQSNKDKVIMAHTIFQRGTAAFMAISLLMGCSGYSPTAASDLKGYRRPTPLNPAQAKVTISLQPTTGPVLAGDTSVTAPVMQVEFSGAESYMVLRCPAAYVPTSAGIDARLTPDLDLQAQRFVWLGAFDTKVSKCVQLGNNVTRTKFTDLTTVNGKEYFYILNPCVSLERSTSQTETCSYNLTYSKSVTGVRSELSDQFDKDSSTLAAADAKLTGLYQRLYYYAETVRLNQETCEINAAAAAARASFWRGIISLVAIGVGAFVGGALFGPLAQIQSSQQVLGLARGLFPASKPSLDCPAAQEDADKASETVTKLDSALKEVLAARRQLAKTDAAYTDIDTQILNNTAATEAQAQ
jgi:hypothetical protein